MKILHSFFFTMSFVLMVHCSVAQTPKIDSLKQELARNSGSDQMDILGDLTYELTDVDNHDAFRYGKQWHQAALATGDTVDLVKSGRMLGLVLRRLDRLDESISILSYVLPISRRWKLKQETERVLGSLAISYTFTGEYDKALESNLNCLLLRQAEDDKEGMGRSFVNIGVLHYKLGNLETALEYYFKALKIKNEIADSSDVNTLLVNIGLCNNYLGNYAEAEGYFKKVFERCLISFDQKIMMECELGIANCFMKQKRYVEAKQHYLRSLTFSINEKNTRFQIDNLLDLIKISITLNNLAEAEINLNTLISIHKLDQYKELKLDVYSIQAEFHEARGNFRSANFFRKKYSDLREKIFDAEQSRNLTKIQTQFSERENLARIESQANILNLQEKTLQQKELLNVFIGIIAVLTMGWVFILFRMNQQKRQINTILDMRVKERTLELEENRDDLRHAHNMQALVLKQISSESISHLATVKGLSNVACKELPDEHAVYFKKVEQAVESLFFNIRKHIPNEEI